MIPAAPGHPIPLLAPQLEIITHSVNKIKAEMIIFFADVRLFVLFNMLILVFLLEINFLLQQNAKLI
jgi:hypothetical protein